MGISDMLPFFWHCIAFIVLIALCSCFPVGFDVTDIYITVSRVSFIGSSYQIKHCKNDSLYSKVGQIYQCSYCALGQSWSIMFLFFALGNHISSNSKKQHPSMALV